MTGDGADAGGLAVWLLLLAIAASLLGYHDVARAAFWGSVALVGLVVFVILLLIVAMVVWAWEPY